MTFKERYLRGECAISVINDWADAWRQAGLDLQALPAVLGLSEEEYRLWAVVGDEALAKRLSDSMDSPFTALHLDWDGLDRQLRDLVRSLLGAAYDTSIRRADYYYWDLKLSIPKDVDEDTSERICTLLELEEIDMNHFVWAEDVGNGQLNGLLSKLVHREVDSNHADDYGVWLICRDGRPLAKEDV